MLQQQITVWIITYTKKNKRRINVFFFFRYFFFIENVLIDFYCSFYRVYSTRFLQCCICFGNKMKINSKSILLMYKSWKIDFNLFKSIQMSKCYWRERATGGSWYGIWKVQQNFQCDKNLDFHYYTLIYFQIRLIDSERVLN